MSTAAGGMLLERETELEVITTRVARAAAGEAGLVVIEGRAGIGKSRLLATLRARAEEDGLRVLAARGSELEREFPYGVVRQLFEPPLMDPSRRERWLSGPAAPAGAVFDAAGEGGPDASFAALHGLYWLVVNAAADSPLMVLVDDLHWVDRPSLRFLAYLAKRLEGMPTTLVTTFRSTDPGTDPAIVGEIVQDPAATVLRPAPFSDAATGALIGTRLGEDPDPAFIAACQSTSGGNPLLLEQLLRSLQDDHVPPRAESAGVVREIGPRAVSRTVLLRLARLSPAAARVAQAISVLGDRADLPIVAALTGLPESTVAEATGELGHAEILRQQLPFAFVHPLVRDAVAHDMAPAARELLHARAAELMAAAGAPPEQVAAHLLEISPRGDAGVVESLRAAAAAAAGRGAPESAVALLRRALEEPPEPALRAHLLLELGRVESQVDGIAAAEHLTEALDLLDGPSSRAQAGYSLAWLLLFQQRAGEGGRLAADLRADVPADAEEMRDALLGVELTSNNFGAQRPGALARYEELRHAPVRDTPAARGLASLTSFDWMIRGGTKDECAPLARAALADGVIYRAADGFVTSMAAHIVLDLAEAPDAEPAWRACLSEVHRLGSDFGRLGVLLWHGWGLLGRGDLAEAEESLEDAVELLQRWGWAGADYTIGFLALTKVAMGKHADAHRALRLVPISGTPGDGNMLALQGRIALALAEGRHADALEDAGLLRDMLTERTIVQVANPAMWPWRSLTAQALDGLGRTEEAIPLLHEELVAAHTWGVPGTTGRTLRILGELERADGEEHLRQAVELLAGSTARLEHARALVALGRRLRLDKRPTEAREPLREAVALSEACGSPALLETARGELLATGARPRTTALAGVDALTPSERRVAALAAEGRTNRDIAQELYVTLKTVELHLSSAYRKLGVRSRRELPAAMSGAE